MSVTVLDEAARVSYEGALSRVERVSPGGLWGRVLSGPPTTITVVLVWRWRSRDTAKPVRQRWGAMDRAGSHSLRSHILDLLVAGKSHREVTEEHGIRGSTLWCWTNEPGFIRELRERKQVLRDMREDGLKAVQTLRESIQRVTPGNTQ